MSATAFLGSFLASWCSTVVFCISRTCFMTSFTDVSFPVPMLKVCPMLSFDFVNAAETTASIMSDTYTKSLVCSPSP